MYQKIVFIFLIFIVTELSVAQNRVQLDSVALKTENNFKKTAVTWNTDPLSPARAAFYSAVLPGLGQIYNKSYWKLPLVYAAIGVPVYFYIKNTNQFNRYQSAYKRRLMGFTDDEFYGSRADGKPRLSTEGLQRAQQFYRRNQELSLLITIGLYALNIIDANVDAHLQQFNVDENLSIQPFFQQNEFNYQPQFGVGMNYKF